MSAWVKNGAATFANCMVRMAPSEKFGAYTAPILNRLHVSRSSSTSAAVYPDVPMTGRMPSESACSASVFEAGYTVKSIKTSGLCEVASSAKSEYSPLSSFEFGRTSVPTTSKPGA